MEKCQYVNVVQKFFFFFQNMDIFTIFMEIFP